jgi:hypothetical protein
MRNDELFEKDTKENKNRYKKINKEKNIARKDKYEKEITKKIELKI